MHDDRSIASSPNPGSGAPPPKHKPIGRVLFWACLPCFLWPPLTVLFEKLLEFGSIAFRWPAPVVIASHLLPVPVFIASVILYPACFTKSSPVFRALMVLLIGTALYWCAWVLWVFTFLIFLKLTGGGAPFPT